MDKSKSHISVSHIFFFLSIYFKISYLPTWELQWVLCTFLTGNVMVHTYCIKKEKDKYSVMLRLRMHKAIPLLHHTSSQCGAYLTTDTCSLLQYTSVLPSTVCLTSQNHKLPGTWIKICTEESQTKSMVFKNKNWTNSVHSYPSSHHHQEQLQQCYSPQWTLTVWISFCQHFPFMAMDLQFLSPAILASRFTLSTHHSFSLLSLPPKSFMLWHIIRNNLEPCLTNFRAQKTSELVLQTIP